MNILALVTDAYGGYGGIAQYNRDLLHAIAAIPAVSAVSVLPRIAPDPVMTLPEKVHQAKPVAGKLKYTLTALLHALRTKPDVVICGHLYHGPLALLIAKAFGAKLVSQLHGTEIWTPLRPRDRRPLVASDVILTVSRDTLRRLRAQVLEAVKTGVVVANTVQSDFKPADRVAARARFDIRDSQKALLTVSRLDTREGYKGHDRVIRLLPRLAAAGHDIVYCIAGSGDDRPRLEALTRDLKVERQVRFLGKVPHNHLPDLYRAADLFVLPSTGEGFGIVYLEAMACGTPALGLNVGGAPDALCDGDLGWCVDPEALADAVQAALAAPRPDPDQLHGMVQARFGRAVFGARIAQVMATLQ